MSFLFSPSSLSLERRGEEEEKDEEEEEEGARGRKNAETHTSQQDTEHNISTYGFVLYDNGRKWLA